MQLDSSISRIKETFENWEMYAAVVRHNYMLHDELIGGLKTIAAKVPGGLRMVDLGCGDSWLATSAFRDFKVDSYLGVDLSESATQRGRQNTAPWGSHARLICGNIAECVAAEPDRSANLILASNSLHHFSSGDKTAIVRHCFRILSSGGILCWVDPARDEGESREAYLARLTNVMQHEWVELTVDQRRRATEHVWASDYPETENWMLELTAQAGFAFTGRFLHDSLFGAWEFIKP
jgi:ubiquinone/menaquinone biosynthesis C-methylase UbiE